MKTSKKMKTGNDMLGLRGTLLLCDSETESDCCSPCIALPTQPKNVNDDTFVNLKKIDIKTSDNSGPLPKVAICPVFRPWSRCPAQFTTLSQNF